MKNENPQSPRNGPHTVAVEAGKTYWWCSCGKSKLQPFCDGSHKDTESMPVEYRAVRSGEVHFCGCKRTANKPLCDGSHAKQS